MAPLGPVLQAACDERWARLLTELKKDPQGAKETNENGPLPLHGAAAFEAPVEVVRALLEAHPQGAKEKNEDGKTPLDRAETEEVRELLRNPPALTSWLRCCQSFTWTGLPPNGQVCPQGEGEGRRERSRPG